MNLLPYDIALLDIEMGMINGMEKQYYVTDPHGKI